MSSEERMKLIGCACNGETCPYCGTWKKALEEAARECERIKDSVWTKSALEFAARIRALKGKPNA